MRSTHILKEGHDQVKLISVLCVICLLAHGVLFVKYRMSSIMFRIVEDDRLQYCKWRKFQVYAACR